MLDVLESFNVGNSFDYFNVQNISFDHPLTANELEEFKTIIFSLNNLQQIYFKGTIDVDSIETIKNLLAISGFVDDSLVEKYVVRIFSRSDMNRILSSNYDNPDTWHVAYDVNDNSFSLADIPKCRGFYTYIDRISLLSNIEELSEFEKILRVYDIVKMYDFSYDDSNVSLPTIVENNYANSYGFNKLFSFILNNLGFSTFVGREKDSDGNVSYVTIVDVKDDKYDIDGIYLFDPSMDSLPKDTYKSDDIRRINYNYFGLNLSDIDYSLYGDSLIGALGILSIDDFDYSFEKKASNRDSVVAKEFFELNKAFPLKYKDLYERINTSSPINFDIVALALENIYGENKNVDDYYSLIRENYDSRKNELFSLRTEEVLSKLLN